MQSATRRAFINLIDLACQEAVDFVLIAGDLYDGDWKDYNTGLFFNQQMSRLREADIPVFIVYGNHDAGNTMTRQLQLPDNVHEFSARQPETFTLDHLGVAIHGQSFPSRAVTDDLSQRYPQALAGYYNIGLLHTAVNGREGHANYAPCTVQGLLAQGYDYWALGHVHGREVLHEAPFIVFPGNLQGRHAKETGSKGCTLVTVEEAQTTLTHYAVDVLRWEVCSLDISPLHYAEELLDLAREAIAQALHSAEGRPLAVRFNLTGRSVVHGQLHSNPERWINELRAAATDSGLGNVWVEKIQLNTAPALAAPMLEDGPLGELMSTLRRLPVDQAELQSLSAELKQLKQALPLEARHSERGDTVDPDNPDSIRQLLGGVEEFLMARLMMQQSGMQ
jgi:DNA repair exonuclease SbcCD nuclease subunit